MNAINNNTIDKFMTEIADLFLVRTLTETESKLLKNVLERLALESKLQQAQEDKKVGESILNGTFAELKSKD